MTPLDQSYRHIPLTKGQFSIIDAADYEWLMRWKWQAKWDKVKKQYYATRGSDGEYRSMHRQILGLKNGDPRQGDHQDGDPLNNRHSNLRITTYSGNNKNARMRKDNSSGFKGVDFHNGWFRARINKDGRSIYLGKRATAEAAHLELYVPAAKDYHSDFARFS